jgi:hypothetical protein
MRAGKRMPALPDTGRRYLDQTRRARLASPGIERFVREKNRAPRPIVLAALLAAAMIAAMIWLSQNG